MGEASYGFVGDRRVEVKISKSKGMRLLSLLVTAETMIE